LHHTAGYPANKKENYKKLWRGETISVLRRFNNLKMQHHPIQIRSRINLYTISENMTISFICIKPCFLFADFVNLRQLQVKMIQYIFGEKNDAHE